MREIALVLLLEAVLLNLTGIHASCPIEWNTPSVAVRYGASVSANCSALSEDVDTMGLEAPSESGGISATKTRQLTWSVETLIDWSIKPIKCYVNMINDSTNMHQCKKILPVIIYKFPNKMTVRNMAGLMNEGKVHRLACDVEDVAPLQNLVVTWYNGHKTIRSDRYENDSTEPVDQSYFLDYSPKRDDNGTQISCGAHFDLGTDGPKESFTSQAFAVIVNFGPYINCSDVEILEGQSLASQCVVTGQPAPYVTWQTNGKTWDPTIPLLRKHAGLYEVKAQGHLNTSQSVMVSVLYKPVIECKSIVAAEYSIPDMVRVNGHPPPTITWYKEGQVVDFHENLTRHDAGNYTIIASNVLSNVSCHFEIDIEYPPSEIAELEDIEIEVGSSVGLKCSSNGNPRPEYYWDYYEAANVIVENEDGVSHLHIQSATGVNIGYYTCHANNSRGHFSKKARIAVKGAYFQCPIEITPGRLEVPYSDPGLETCQPAPNTSKSLKEIYWQVGHRIITDSQWRVDSHQDWEPRAVCIATFEGIGTCNKSFDLTLYKTPDVVLIHSVNHTGPMVADTECHLQCDILNVAPVQNLTVRWYKGNHTIKDDGNFQVTGCTHQNKMYCDNNVIRAPVNVSSIISVTLEKDPYGVEFKCEAQLDLKPGSHPPLTMTSRSLNITRMYKPIINTTKLPSRIPVFRGYPVELVCEADGHPPPEIHWFSEKGGGLPGGHLTVVEAGFYTCNGTNQAGSSIFKVEVILKEDYLPLIAGFVAATVVVISAVFIFFYSIYYKNTKMRRYSFKNPKLNTQNGNVAHNSWETQLPMTKLS